MTPPPPLRYESTILANRRITPRVFELVLARRDLVFVAGSEVMVHGSDPSDDRQYSIASGIHDPELRLLIRLIPEGTLTPKLAAMAPGNPLSFTGPFGSFLLRDFLAPMVFICTGTGLAPALCFLRSHPGIDLTVVHGIRSREDLWYEEEIRALTAYHPCVSGRDPGKAFHGRVTDWLEGRTFAPETHYYLCGANPMIVDARKLLKHRGVADDQIFTEAYYFW